MPPEIKLTAWPLKKICGDVDFKYGDRILCRTFNWAEGIVEMAVQPSSLSDFVISGDDVRINPYALFNRLSFSHVIEFMKLPVEMLRTFYAYEAIRGTWSVRALRRQIGPPISSRAPPRLTRSALIHGFARL